MNRQLFATGQIVCVAHGSLSGPSTARRYRIVRRYPVEGLPPVYHIRSVGSREQRMVAEGELSVVVPNAFGTRTDQNNWSGSLPRLSPSTVP